MAKLIRFPLPDDRAEYRRPLRGLSEFRVCPLVAPNTIAADRASELVSDALTDNGIGVSQENEPVLVASTSLFQHIDLDPRVIPQIYLSVWGMAKPLHQSKPAPMCFWRSPSNHVGMCAADLLGELCVMLLSTSLDEFVEHWKAANGVP